MAYQTLAEVPQPFVICPLLSWAASLALVFSVWAADAPKVPFYQFTIDLTKVKQDKVAVNLIVTPQKKKEVTLLS